MGETDQLVDKTHLIQNVPNNKSKSNCHGIVNANTFRG